MPGMAGGNTNCVFRVRPESTGICQLRLDFETFTLTQNGNVCTGAMTDSLQVDGPTARDPDILCGNLGGQHSKF